MFYIGLLPSTALYGLICLGFSWIVLGLNPVSLFDIATESSGLGSAFCWFMLASIPGIIISSIIVSVARKVSRRRSPDFDWDSFHMTFFDYLGNDLSNIVRGLKSIEWSFEKMDFDYGVTGALLSRLETVVHAIWAITLIGFIGAGFYSLIQLG